MAGRSGGRKFSFDLLAGDSSGDDRSLLPNSGRLLANGDDGGRLPRRRRKPNASVKNKKKMAAERPASEEPSLLVELGDEKLLAVENGHRKDGIGFRILENRSVVETVCESTVVEVERGSSQVSCVSFAEFGQRNVTGSGAEEPGEEVMSTMECSAGQWKPESNGGVTKLVKEEALDWNGMMTQDPKLPIPFSFVDRSPFKYFVGEIYGGSSLRGTISAGNEKKRQRVYNTMFHVPWRCERASLSVWNLFCHC